MVSACPKPVENTLSRGGRRARELAAEYAAEANAEAEKLRADLGRDPTHLESILIETAAALAVRARRLRALGRSREADDASRLLIRALGRLNISTSEARPMPSIAEMLAARGYSPPVVVDDEAGAGDAAEEKPATEALSGPDEVVR